VEPDQRKRIDLAEQNFNFGLQSVDDVELTLANHKTAAADDSRGGGETLRQRAIHHIWDNAKNPLGAEWDWARRGDTKRARYRRWRSLQAWAKGRMENPPEGSSAEEKAKWRARWNGIRKIYRRKKIQVLKRILADDQVDNPSWGTRIMDGKAVPNWIADILQDCRDNGWPGIVISGFRDPDFSEQLCFDMCGHPTCPGTCGGRFSNHACPPSGDCVDGEGATDNSEWGTLDSVLQRRGHWDRLKNDLPNDRPHHSRTGH
jgi:hypothetical protein